MCVRQLKGTVSTSGARFGRALRPQGRGGSVTDPEQDAQAPVNLGSADPGDAAAAFSPRPNAGPHFSPAERVARGRAARVELPRSVHAGWEPAPLRRDPVELLEQQARTRLPELIAIRYGRMLESPFAFYRGGAYLMAATSLPVRAPVCTPNCAAMLICRTSGSSRHLTADSFSRSTTSTRRFPARSSGTSSASRRASPSLAGSSVTTRPRGVRW